jgi:type IV secretion system protein VirB9
MLKVKYAIYFALIALVVTVSYASAPSGGSRTPLGVVPKGEGKVPAASSEQAVAPVVPAIPQEMQPELADTPRSEEIEAVAPGEGETVKGRKPAKKTTPKIFNMPAQDRRIVDAAVRGATQRPGNAASSESKTVYSYTPDSIYTLYGAPGRVIDIQLQSGEKLSGPVIAGDTVRWVVGTTVSGNGASAVTHVLVKPVQAGIETNFIITTDRRSYHLIAKSLNRNSLPTVSWTYPHDEMSKLDAYSPDGQSSGSMLAAGDISPDRLNFKYRIKPDDDYPWTPIRVFDDGAKTYIQMSHNMKNTEAPAFFIKGKEGLNLVNYRVRGDYYVVDRLFEEGEFRCGKDEIVKIHRESEKDNRKLWSFFGS